jgi:signal transduction histidine kinase
MHSKQELVHEKQEKMLALQQLVVGVNHEMNTPIGNINLSNSFLSDINNQLAESDISMLTQSEFTEYLEQQASAISTIKSSSMTLSGLTHIFKSININEEEHPKDSFDLSALIKDKFETENNSLEYHLEMPSKLVINSYPSAFNLIFDQLLSNSKDHFPEDKIEQLAIALKVEVINKELRIVFSDNGKGLPAEEIEHLFLPFFTTARGVKKKLGLGMYLLKNIITDLLVGSIQASSSKDSGLELTICIPINDRK